MHDGSWSSNSMSMNSRFLVFTVIVASLATGCATTNTAHEVDAFDAPGQAKEHGVGHKIIWYVPNRFLDLVDIFRLRLRVGPGLAVNARLTEHADAYIGTYYAGFVGLPGPRMAPDIRYPAGLEYEKGIMLLGVDATDDLPHEPDYSPTEIVMGLHLLLLGADIGLDPVELGDFFSGWIMIDLREDDR